MSVFFPLRLAFQSASPQFVIAIFGEMVKPGFRMCDRHNPGNPVFRVFKKSYFSLNNVLDMSYERPSVLLNVYSVCFDKAHFSLNYGMLRYVGIRKCN